MRWDREKLDFVFSFVFLFYRFVLEFRFYFSVVFRFRILAILGVLFLGDRKYIFIVFLMFTVNLVF